MLRLHRERSRTLSGEICSACVQLNASCMATYRVTEQKSAEVIVPVSYGEGPNTKDREGASMSSHDAMNPKGGAYMGHVIEQPNPNVNLLKKNSG